MTIFCLVSISQLNPIAEWKFNYETDIIEGYVWDETSNWFVGDMDDILLGNITPDVGHSGLNNDAYSFNGGDIDIDPYTLNNLDLDSISITGWIKIDNSTEGNVFKLRCIGPYKFIELIVDHNKLRLQSYGYQYGGKSCEITLSENDSWYFYSITCSSSDNVYNLYLFDGNTILHESYSTSASDGLFTGTTINDIEIFKIGNANFLNGILDDITIYDKVLNESEIISLYDLTTEKIEVENIESNVTVYPNPTTDYVKVSDNNVKTNLYNSTGQLVLNGDSELDLRSLSNGIYILFMMNIIT